MPPEFESIINTGSLYIQYEDGSKVDVGEIKNFDITIDVANDKDFTGYILGRQECDCTFKFKTINKSIFRELTDKSYFKYLKRVNNRNKLFNKLKKKGRKL